MDIIFNAVLGTVKGSRNTTPVGWEMYKAITELGLLYACRLDPKFDSSVPIPEMLKRAGLKPINKPSELP